MAKSLSFLFTLLVQNDVLLASRRDIRSLALSTHLEKASCMQLEAAQDEYKEKCKWLWCGSKTEVPTKSIDFCEHAKPHFIINIGFSVTMPVFKVPLSKVSVQLLADGSMEYQEPMASSVFKSLQVSAGLGVHVTLGVGEIVFGFSGSLTVRCIHCENFSTLWNTLIALLIHDYFKFVRKSAEETAEVMQTLTDGLRDAEELVDRSIPGSVRMQQFHVNVEYTGKFFASVRAALKLPMILNMSGEVEGSYESHRKTLVAIGPWGPPEEDDTGTPLPTYTMFIDDSGYGMVSVARAALTNMHGTLEAVVKCDSENGFGLEVSLKSDKPASNATDTSVAMWQVSMDKIMKDPRFDNGYCIPGRWWGHRKMFDRVAAAKDVFLPLLKSRTATGTEMIALHISSGSPNAKFSLRRESELDHAPGVPPVISTLISSGIALAGDTVHFEQKQVDDVGAAYLLDLYG